MWGKREKYLLLILFICIGILLFYPLFVIGSAGSEKEFLMKQISVMKELGMRMDLLYQNTGEYPRKMSLAELCKEMKLPLQKKKLLLKNLDKEKYILPAKGEVASGKVFLVLQYKVKRSFSVDSFLKKYYFRMEYKANTGVFCARIWLDQAIKNPVSSEKETGRIK